MSSLSKKIRFEVFKRDKFTCQYCGREAPDVVLQADHIHPKSKDGSNDLMNLITSCFDCNQGKKDRLLSDDSAIKKKKRQLDDLQERREQIEMMMEWQRGLMDLDEFTIDQLSSLWSDLVPGYNLNDAGTRTLQRHIRKFGVKEVTEAMRISSEQYLEWDKKDDSESPTRESADKAFHYIPKICANKRRLEKKPHLRRLYYIRGILKNRLPYYKHHQCITMMDKAVQAGIDVEDIEDLSKEVKNWTEFRVELEVLISNISEEVSNGEA